MAINAPLIQILWNFYTSNTVLKYFFLHDKSKALSWVRSQLGACNPNRNCIAEGIQKGGRDPLQYSIL